MHGVIIVTYTTGWLEYLMCNLGAEVAQVQSRAAEAQHVQSWVCPIEHTISTVQSQRRSCTSAISGSRSLTCAISGMLDRTRKFYCAISAPELYMCNLGQPKLHGCNLGHAWLRTSGACGKGVWAHYRDVPPFTSSRVKRDTSVVWMFDDRLVDNSLVRKYKCNDSYRNIFYWI